MAASKLHRSMESSRSPDGFQGKAVSPCNQLVAEAEEPVTVSTCCWGQAGAVEVGFFEHRFSSANCNGTRMIPHHPQVPPLHAGGYLVLRLCQGDAPAGFCRGVHEASPGSEQAWVKMR